MPKGDLAVTFEAAMRCLMELFRLVDDPFRYEEVARCLRSWLERRDASAFHRLSQSPPRAPFLDDLITPGNGYRVTCEQAPWAQYLFDRALDIGGVCASHLDRMKMTTTETAEPRGVVGSIQGVVCAACGQRWMTDEGMNNGAARLFCRKDVPVSLAQGVAEPLAKEVLAFATEPRCRARAAELAVAVREQGVPLFPGVLHWTTTLCPACGKRNWAVHYWNVMDSPLALSDVDPKRYRSAPPTSPTFDPLAPPGSSGRKRESR